MNKKGFTLVELLATIIILSILVLIASTSVTGVIRNAKKDLYNTQIELIKSAAEVWGASNINKLSENNTCYYLTLEDLKNEGLLDRSIINSMSKEEISNDMKIKINTYINEYGRKSTTYEVDVDTSMCLPFYICKAVTRESASKDSKGNLIGNIPTNQYLAGDEYICEVKDNTFYHFYVLGINENETVNLIMNQNINSDGSIPVKGIGSTGESVYDLVAWDMSGENISGPVTAMEFVYKATNSWTYIPPLTFSHYNLISNYGYKSFISIDGISTIKSLDGAEIIIGTKSNPLKARLPLYLPGSSKTEISDIQSSNFLYDNLDLTLSRPPYGYWTMSAKDAVNFAWALSLSGNTDFFDTNDASDFGVRPVITIPKFRMK